MTAKSEHVLDNFVTSNIVRLASKFTRHGEMFLQREAGIGVIEWRMLVWMERLIEPTERELASQLDQPDERISMLAGRLAESGWVKELEDENGQVRYRLTEDGDALFDRILPLMHRRQAMLTEDEDPDEIAFFINILRRLEATVDKAVEVEGRSEEA